METDTGSVPVEWRSCLVATQTVINRNKPRPVWTLRKVGYHSLIYNLEQEESRVPSHCADGMDGSKCRVITSFKKVANCSKGNPVLTWCEDIRHHGFQ